MPVILTKEQAVEIYKIKLVVASSALAGGLLQQRNPTKTTSIGRFYNVSPKAVRDIWNHVTWKSATSFLWINVDESELLIQTVQE
jgi:hypothetical protein